MLHCIDLTPDGLGHKPPLLDTDILIRKLLKLWSIQHLLREKLGSIFGLRGKETV